MGARIPTFCITPPRAVIVAAWRAGTWSAIVARYAAKQAFAASWPTNQAMMSVGTLVAIAMTNRHAANTTAPPTIHGRRRPHRLGLRAEDRPYNGVAPRAAVAAA